MLVAQSLVNFGKRMQHQTMGPGVSLLGAPGIATRSKDATSNKVP